jgi:hypothetical protein
MKELMFPIVLVFLLIGPVFARECPEELYTHQWYWDPQKEGYFTPGNIGSVVKQEEMPFYIYMDKGSKDNHFFPFGLMGDYSDIKYSYTSKENPYSGNTCIKIEYCACGFQGARWAGMFWQNPANNWGEVDAGYNLSKATKLTFWARGAKGGENIDEFKVGGVKGTFSDSDSATTGPVVLNKEWTKYAIDLTGKNMSYIIGGFCWVAKIDANLEGAIFYLDEIKFE